MTINNEFNKIASKYNSQRKKFIPFFDDFYGIATESALFTDNVIMSPNILDLGAGTGIFSDFILEKYPEAKIELVDISEDMIDVAKNNLKKYSNADIKVTICDLNDFNSENQETYDLIISSLAIHHLESIEKRRLYEKIFHLLKDGGIFVNADQFLGGTKELETIYRKIFDKIVLSAKLSQKEIEEAYERVRLDIREPLSAQMKWLRKIGFSEVDCLYKNYSFGVLWAKK